MATTDREQALEARVDALETVLVALLQAPAVLDAARQAIDALLRQHPHLPISSAAPGFGVIARQARLDLIKRTGVKSA